MKNGKQKNLSEALATHTSGWVALDKENNVVAHDKDFTAICEKVKNKKNIVLIPASKNYFGFITIIDG